jgi:hypothetical protein
MTTSSSLPPFPPLRPPSQDVNRPAAPVYPTQVLATAKDTLETYLHNGSASSSRVTFLTNQVNSLIESWRFAKKAVLAGLAGMGLSGGVLGVHAALDPPEPAPGMGVTMKSLEQETFLNGLSQAGQLGLLVSAIIASVSGGIGLADRSRRLQLAQELETVKNRTISTYPEFDPVKQRINRALKDQCEVLAQEVSKKAQEQRQASTFSQEPYSVQDLIELYSDPKSVDQLARFIAYHWLLAEKQAGLRPNEVPVSQGDLLIRQFTVLTTVRKTALAMELLRDQPQEQQLILNTALLPTLTEVRMALESQLSQVIPGLNQEQELARFVHAAKTLNQPFQLGTMAKPEEGDEVNLISQRLATLKVTNDAALQAIIQQSLTQPTILDQALRTEQRARLLETLVDVRAELSDEPTAGAVDSPLAKLAQQPEAEANQVNRSQQSGPSTD